MISRAKTNKKRNKKYMKKMMIIAAAAALIAGGYSAQAQLTTVNPGDNGDSITPSLYTPPSNLTEEYSVSQGFDLSGTGTADIGTLVTTVYTGSGTSTAGETFIYSITLTSGDVTGITANGFLGSVGVDTTLLGASSSYITGGVSIVGNDSTSSAQFVVATSVNSYASGEIAFKDNNGGDINSLVPAAVPEASTVMAGALMILPLGIGAFRAVRKERLA
ncbi:MAG: hypothetical protein ACLQSR_00635 [Limisphaerales bacterium]